MNIGLLAGQSLPAQTKNAEVSGLWGQIVKERETSNSLLLKYSWTSRTEVLKSREILNIIIEKRGRRRPDDAPWKLPSNIRITSIYRSDHAAFSWGHDFFLMDHDIPDRAVNMKTRINLGLAGQFKFIQVKYCANFMETGIVEL